MREGPLQPRRHSEFHTPSRDDNNYPKMNNRRPFGSSNFVPRISGAYPRPVRRELFPRLRNGPTLIPHFPSSLFLSNACNIPSTDLADFSSSLSLLRCLSAITFRSI